MGSEETKLLYNIFRCAQAISAISYQSFTIAGNNQRGCFYLGGVHSIRLDRCTVALVRPAMTYGAAVWHAPEETRRKSFGTSNRTHCTCTAEQVLTIQLLGRTEVPTSRFQEAEAGVHSFGTFTWGQLVTEDPRTPRDVEETIRPCK